MKGLGTIINSAAVIIGGVLGIVIKKGINENIKNSLLRACGLATVFLGIAGAMTKMLVFKDGSLETAGTMTLIFSLVIGTIIGELAKIEDGMEKLGEKIRKKAGGENDGGFIDGFVNTSLVICVGAMAIVGSIEDGTRGDYSMLAAKAVLDGILVMVFSSTYGKGAVFSVIPLFVFQGTITAISALCGSFLTQDMVDNISYVGSVLIFCVGVNIAFKKLFRVGNMLPAVVLPVIYELVRSVF